MSAQHPDASSAVLTELQARIDALERKRWVPSSGSPKHNSGGKEEGDDAAGAVVVDEQMRRARMAVEKAGVYSAVWKSVPSSYYTWPLEKRAECLRAPSIHHLCKSLLFENRKTNYTKDPTNPKFVLVIVQYAATLDVKKLVNAIRTLRPNVKDRLDAKTQFDFRKASAEDNDAITGYKHNSVTPFGLLQPEKVRIVLSSALVPLKIFWMGGGHVHVKLSTTVSDFCAALDPVVADISQPRSTRDDGGAVNEGFDD